MTVTEEDKQAVGYTDMRVFREWLKNAPAHLRVLALLFPPSVYRMVDPKGDVARVVPDSYFEDEEGNLLMNVIMPPEINPEYPLMRTARITGVPPSRLTAIKWPPDARVH